jgi:hypothetical protein
MSVVAGAAAQPHGVGVQQLYDGTEYWGEWQGGKMHGWGVWRTIDGETEYRGQLFDGKYCGYGVLRECGTVKTGRWVDGTIVVQQRFSASAMFAARDAAIRAGVAARHIVICERFYSSNVHTYSSHYVSFHMAHHNFVQMQALPLRAASPTRPKPLPSP